MDPIADLVNTIREKLLALRSWKFKEPDDRAYAIRVYEGLQLLLLGLDHYCDADDIRSKRKEVREQDYEFE